MPYIGLGSRMVTAAADTTGLNTGNLTAYFSSAVLAIKQSNYEIYSMSITGLTQVATLVVYVNNNVRTTVKLAGNSEWDPSQPVLMNATDELIFAWNLASSVTPVPSATVWLRYDPTAQPPGGF